MSLVVYGAGAGALNGISRYPDTNSPELVPLAQMRAEQSGEIWISAEDHAASQREKYVDELADLADQDSNLGRREFTLMLERAELTRDLVQNRLVCKWLRAEQDDIKQSITRIQREQGDFEKRDAERRKRDQSK